jgi:electron transfer flavoprotein beta subunit
VFADALGRWATGFRWQAFCEAVLRILVFAKIVCDVKVPVAHEKSTGRIENEKNVLVVDPADLSAIRSALEIREYVPGTHVTIVHLGPPSSEAFLRRCLAMGCDGVIRVWDETIIADLHTQTKALILSRVAEVLSFDLVLAGARSQDTRNGQLGILVASRFRVPLITCATSMRWDGQRLAVSRRLSDGSLPHLESPVPLVVTGEADDGGLEPPSFAALLNAAEGVIPCLDFTDIGIPDTAIREAESLLVYSPLHAPGARLNYVPAPDSSLPAYERRMRLLEGSVTKRQGRVVTGDEDEIVEEIFRALLDEGWLREVPSKG